GHHNRTTFGGVKGIRMDVGTPGRGIQTRRPIYRSNSRSGDELSRDAVQHVEVTVLVHLHDDLPVASPDLNIGKHQVLDGVKVPLVTRSALEVPLQLSGIDINGKDGCHVEIVEALRSF